MADCSPTAPTRVKSFWTFKPGCVAVWDRRSPTCWMANSTSLCWGAWAPSVIVEQGLHLRAALLQQHLPEDADRMIRPTSLRLRLPQGSAMAAVAEAMVPRRRVPAQPVPAGAGPVVAAAVALVSRRVRR